MDQKLKYLKFHTQLLFGVGMLFGLICGNGCAVVEIPIKT